MLKINGVLLNGPKGAKYLSSVEGGIFLASMYYGQSSSSCPLIIRRYVVLSIFRVGFIEASSHHITKVSSESSRPTDETLRKIVLLELAFLKTSSHDSTNGSSGSITAYVILYHWLQPPQIFCLCVYLDEKQLL